MSTHRDFKQDREATRNMVLQRRTSVAAKNWLGHDANSGAAKIDEMLLDGATWEDLQTTRGAVQEHLRHLEKEHGLKIIEDQGTGKFLFDRRLLGISTEAPV